MIKQISLLDIDYKNYIILNMNYFTDDLYMMDMAIVYRDRDQRGSWYTYLAEHNIIISIYFEHLSLTFISFIFSMQIYVYWSSKLYGIIWNISLS